MYRIQNSSSCQQSFHEFHEEDPNFNFLYERKKLLTREWSESTLVDIGTKKVKVSEYHKAKNQKKDLYWKLSQKLEAQLRQIKNHNTAEAREKLRLLQKCRNQKHIRYIANNEQGIPIKNKSYYTSSQKTSIYRPQTGYSCSTANQISRRTTKRICNNNTLNVTVNEKQNIGKCEKYSIHKKIQEIKQNCFQQFSRSQQIREDISTVNFYQKLVSKNSNIIFNKIL